MAAGRFVVPPWFPARDRSGRLVAGALFGVYTNGTTTKASIYSDEALTTALTNPVSANSSGQFPAIWAEAGTADDPTLYRVAISGPNGESIVNPAIFDNWQPSLDAETAQTALAEAASQATQDVYADILAIQALGDDAAAIATRAAKSANLSDLADRQAATENLQFKHDTADAVVCSLHDKIAAGMPLDIRLDFGAVGDGTTDDAPAFQKAADYGQGRPILVPSDGYEFAIKTTVTVQPTALRDLPDPPSGTPGSYAPGLWLVGDGMAESVIRPMVPGGVAFDLDALTPDEFDPPEAYSYRSQQGIRVENIAFVGSNAVANSSCFKLRNCSQAKFSQVHIRNLTGSAFILVNGDFVDDGWNMVAFEGVWIEACQSWGIDATGSAGRNEGSFTHMKHVFIQGCGKNEYFRVTGISTGNPAVVTVSMLQVPTVPTVATAHPFVEGDRIKLWGVKSTITLGNNPIATTNGSRAVVITSTAHGRSRGDTVTLAGATAVGGITVSGEYTIASVATNTFTIVHSSAATSTATGGGASVTCLGNLTAVNETILKVGPSPTATTFSLYTDAASPVAVNGSGFGTLYNPLSTVTLGNNPITTTNGSATVTISHTAHGAATTDTVTFSGASAVGGITISGEYRIASVVDANTYTITHTSAATSSATGGGASVSATYYKQLGVCVPEVSYYEPQSGGMRWKGQLLHMDQCGFTVNQNCAFYVKGQSGLGIGVLTHAVTWENNYRRHVFCTGITNWRSEGCQFHGNQSYKQWAGVDFDATDYTVRGVQWVNTKVRARSGEGFGFRLAGTSALKSSCRVRTTIWDDFDYAGQRRFIGWEFDQVAQDCTIRTNSTSLVTLGPSNSIGVGNKTPLRLRGPENAVSGGAAAQHGEYIEHPVSNSGLSLSNASNDDEGSALAANTTYNVYLYDNDGVPTLVASTVDPTVDLTHGYMVKATDWTKLFVGRVKTASGSTDFLTTGAAFLDPIGLNGTVQGTPEWLWHSASDRKLWLKLGSRPTADAGGTYGYWPTFEGSAAYDPPSLAPGAETTSDVTITSGAGDYGGAVAFSLGWGGLVAVGTMKAANTVTVWMRCPSSAGGAIDLAAGTLRPAYQRR